MVLDGYVFGTMAIALAPAAEDLGVSAWWMGLISAGALVGIFLGSLVVGWASDRFGRRKLFVWELALFIVAGVAQLWAPGPASLFAVRVALGVAIGSEYAIGAAMLAEFSPRRQRGAALSSLQTFWLVGYVIAYFTGYALDAAGVPWRWILASTAFVAVLVLLSRLRAPESPRWLASKGRLDEARAVVRRHYGAQYGVDDLALERNAHLRYAVLFSPRYRTRTAFAATFWTCQITCAYAILLFMPMIFTSLGIAEGLTADIAINSATVVGGALGIYLCWRLARRPLVIWSFVLMTSFLLVMAAYEHVPRWSTLVAFVVFMLVLNGASNLEFVYPAEMFPTEVRSSAVGFAAATARIGSVVSAFVMPSLLAAIGASWTLAILAAVCACGVVVSVLWAPETRGLSLLESSGVADLAAPAAPAE